MPVSCSVLLPVTGILPMRRLRACSHPEPKKLYQRLPRKQFGSIFDRLMGQLKKGGPEKLLDKCYPVVPPELRESAFANAVDIVLSNGQVDAEEKEFIDDLKKKFEIEDQRAKTIVKVMVYKNHG